MCADSCMEVFLQPGDAYFGDAPDRIRTLLGSCIAITIWHPLLRKGGMVHCLLPSRGSKVAAPEMSGRFVDEGIRWLLREAVRDHVDPMQCEFKLFGGSNMFAGFRVPAPRRRSIGESNAVKACEMLDRLGLHVRVKDFGGTVHRVLVFDLASGDVWVRYGDAVRPDGTGEQACA